MTQGCAAKPNSRSNGRAARAVPDQRSARPPFTKTLGASMDRVLLRERMIYGAAFVVLAVNRLLIRMPEVIVPRSVLEQDESWYYAIGPWFSAVAIAFAIYA